jgi:hypothetical protein
MSIASVIVRADADRRAVDCSDDGLGAIVDRERHTSTGVAHPMNDRRIVQPVVHVCERRVQLLIQAEDIADGREVHAGAVRPACASHDHGLHCVVRARCVKCVDQLRCHLRRERVQLVGTIERDRQDAVGQLVANRLEVHGRTHYAAAIALAARKCSRQSRTMR